MEKFYFEVTDTFGGELNYCWLDKFTIKAKNIRGALIKLSKHTGLNFRFNGCHYKAKNACIAAYEIEFDVNEEWKESSEEL